MWSKAGRFVEGLHAVGVLQLRDKYHFQVWLHVVYLHMLLYLWVLSVITACMLLLLFLHYVV
jgi:hypothetical protein